MEIPWHEIQTRGFVVVPSFLSPTECAELTKEFYQVMDDGAFRGSPNQNSRKITGKAKERLYPKILATAAEVSACTTTKVDMIRSGRYYASELGIKFSWHNDHDSYFFTQDFVSYLNYWVAIQKPDRSRSGLSVAPFDSMKRRFPRLAEWAMGHGAIISREEGGETRFYDSDRVELLEVGTPNALDEIAVTPEIGPGDLILMRGDLFHKTQDSDTSRVAVSFRAVGSGSIMHQSKLMHMGFNKFNIMSGNRQEFVKRFAAFEIAGKDTLTVGECEAICNTLSTKISELCSTMKIESLSIEQYRNLVWELASSFREKSKLLEIETR